MTTGRANIINFIRFDQGIDTVENEMREIVARELPATWLLQYDALVRGPYVNFLKSEAPASHEIGLWFEINRIHCEDAGVGFRGEDYSADHDLDTSNWDHRSRAAMSCGYTQAERIQLIDVMMQRFRDTFGDYPTSVAAWYIDSYSLEYLRSNYHIEASANCRDSWGTDGYCFWGGPLHAFYYPSRTNAMVPGCDADQQIDVPIFRMLNVDPVDAHDLDIRGNGQSVLTLEPAYVPQGGGGHADWVKRYFDLMLNGHTHPFPYFQIGQENGFEWSRIGGGFCFQLDHLIDRICRNQIVVETLTSTARWCRQNFTTTPVGILHGDRSPSGTAVRSFWYHSRHYRAGISYSKTNLRLNALDLYSPHDIEPYRDVPLNTYASAFGSLHLLDSFVMGSGLFLRMESPDGSITDETDCGIHDVALQDKGEHAELNYANSLGVRSRIRFEPNRIVLCRESADGIQLCEMMGYDRESRFQSFHGTFRNELIFGWRNLCLRLQVEDGADVEHRPEEGLVRLTEPTGKKISETIIRFTTEAPR